LFDLEVFSKFLNGLVSLDAQAIRHLCIETIQYNYYTIENSRLLQYLI